MNKILKEILDKSPYFEKNQEDIYIPKYLGLIVNSVVIYDVNWIVVTNEELMLMNGNIKNHPISSIHLKNINSILIITEEGIKEVL